MHTFLDERDKETIDEQLNTLETGVNELKGELVDYMFGSDTQLIPNKYVDGNNGNIGNINGWTLAIKKILPNSKCTFKWGSGIPYIAQYAIYNGEPSMATYVSGKNGASYDVSIPSGNDFYYLAVCINTTETDIDIDTNNYDGLIPTIDNLVNRINNGWENKIIVWLGTSIPEGNTQPPNGYPNVIADRIGATIHNNAIGASKIRKGFSQYVTETNPCGIGGISDMCNLCQTVAEKEYNITHWQEICEERGITYNPISTQDAEFYIQTSYENLLDPYITGTEKADLIVINHGFNDHIGDFNTNPTDPYNTYYFKGAMNFIIRRIKEKSPTTKIVIFGHYQHRNDLLFDSVFTELAQKWNVYYYPLWKYVGWSSETINCTKRVNAEGVWTDLGSTLSLSIKDQWIRDGVHPKGVARDRIAEVSLPLFTSILN